uniref:H15 domain-containing protein n=1 Tax=Acrobeloides nanus TaxID=290746 RepID=A0A914D0I3_9BILA
MRDSQAAKANNSQKAKSDSNVSTPVNVARTSNADFVTSKSTGNPLQVPKSKKVIRMSKPKLVKNRKPEKIHRPGKHPSYKQMIDEVIFSLGSRKGVSRPAIKNYIVKKYPVGDRNRAINTHIRKAINNLVEKNALIVVEGATQKSARYRLAPEVKQRMKQGASKTAPTPKKPKSVQAEAKSKAPNSAKTKGVEAKKAKKTDEAKKVEMTRKPAPRKFVAVACGKFGCHYFYR